MPIYEYRCTQCGNIAEEWVKSFNSPMSEPCPKCGAEAVRIVSDTSFQLKGSGWYVTEYKKSGVSQSHDPSEAHAPADKATDAPKATDTAADKPSAPEAPKAETSAVPATESKTAPAAA